MASSFNMSGQKVGHQLNVGNVADTDRSQIVYVVTRSGDEPPRVFTSKSDAMGFYYEYGKEWFECVIDCEVK